MVLFTNEFKPAIELFKWQLTGDVVKISAWLLSYIMLAKAMTYQYVITEIIFSFILVSTSMISIQIFGLIGVTYAYTITYIIYFLLLYTLIKKYKIIT